MKLLTFLIIASLLGAIGSWMAFYFLWTTFNNKWTLEMNMVKTFDELKNDNIKLTNLISELNKKFSEVDRKLLSSHRGYK